MTRSQASQRIASLLSALALLWCDAAFGQAEAPAEKKPLSFFDPEDGKLDMSDFLLNHKGALPVPVVITEPAVGYGGGLGLMFFSESMADAAASAKASGKGPAPPNITAIGGAYTENGTWGAGVAHFHTWDGDRYRYLGGIAKVNANLDYFGLLNQPRAYELRGVALVQQLLVRVADTRWYVGPRYVYFDSTATFKVGDAGELGSFDKTQRIGKAGLVVDYDSRDNIFYPSRGSYAELEAQFARGGFGSTQSFNMYNARGFTWLPAGAPRDPGAARRYALFHRRRAVLRAAVRGPARGTEGALPGPQCAGGRNGAALGRDAALVAAGLHRLGQGIWALA